MDLSIEVTKGARLDEPFQFLNDDNTPTVLTGLGPFTCQVRDGPGCPLLLDITVVETDLTIGKLNLTASPEATAYVPKRDSLYSLQDANGYLWLNSEVCHFRHNIIS